MFEVRPRDLIWLYIFLLYVPLCLLVYRRLSPSLSPTSRRLSIGMLAAQVLVIVLSLAIRPTSLFQEWIWKLDAEWNIPSALASAQLGLVGLVALFTAWLARTIPAWQRLYLLGLSLVFLFLGLDEFFDFRTSIPNLRGHYLIVGAAMAAATVIVAVRSPRRSWIWQICLLFGLSIAAASGLLLDKAPDFCGAIGFVRPVGGCLAPEYFEESLEILGVWLALIALLGQFSWAAPRPAPRVQLALYAAPALWILLLARASPVPDIPYQKFGYGIQPALVGFESEEYLYGYYIEADDEELKVKLYSYPWASLDIGLGYSIHLIDQTSGGAVASRDNLLKRDRHSKLFGDNFIQVYVQEIDIAFPPGAPPVNRALWVVLTLWRPRDDEYAREKVLSSDLPLLGDSQVILGELVLPSASPAPPPSPLAAFDNGFVLNAPNMPERASAGETLEISFSWRSGESGGEDLAQFLHFGREETGEWFVYDQQPLGPRLPTRLWYAGLADSETWQVALPADLAPGRYSVFTGLYRARDQERVRARQADGRLWLDARVPLGSIMIE
ncbi:MAG: hypothetical protein OXN94_09960 [Chloroflexota bacterium]|nr:hypothetical protein [Chloroflexota bacterium]